MGLDDQKQLLRAEALARRADAHRRLGAVMAGRLAEHYIYTQDPRLAGRTPLAGYVAIRDEADPSALLQVAHDRGIALALPRILKEAAPLGFLSWTPGAALEKGRYGLGEPPLTCSVLRPQVVLVPLLAFDAKGRRLGYGGGYYDRSLSALRAKGPSVVAIGIGYSAQELEALPEGAYDERLDAVLSEDGLRWFAAD